MKVTGDETVLAIHQTSGVSFFLCRQCRLSIALTQQLVHTFRWCQAGVFRNLSNIVGVCGYRDYYRDDDFTAASIYCIMCRSHLGWQMVEVEYRSRTLVPGRYVFFLNKLLKWDGTRLLYAHTNEPVY